MRQLRQKLEVDPPQPKLLISESGVGYRLERHRPLRMVSRRTSFVSVARVLDLRRPRRERRTPPSKEH
jgi:hypothetical protein